jgi:hypothetical protein
MHKELTNNKKGVDLQQKGIGKGIEQQHKRNGGSQKKSTNKAQKKFKFHNITKFCLLMHKTNRLIKVGLSFLFCFWKMKKNEKKNLVLKFQWLWRCCLKLETLYFFF